MITFLRCASASFALSLTVLVHAESAPARPTPARIPSSLLAIIDTDHNGTLSAHEITAAPVILAALDTDGDGIISVTELRDIASDNHRNRAAHGASANLLLALDANHDGAIQPMEIANAVSSLQQLDLNHDGEISPSELRPVMVASSRP